MTQGMTDWQPIETAPKGNPESDYGPQVLLWDAERKKAYVGNWWWSDPYWCRDDGQSFGEWTSYEDRCRNPVLWAPITPPETP